MPKIRAATIAEHRALVWADLLDAFDALVEEQGYDAVTLPDVAARAGIARNSIYRYVDDKTGLLEAAARRSATALDDAVTAADTTARTPSARLDAIVRLLVVSFAHDTRSILMLRTHAAVLSEQDRASALAPFSQLLERIKHIVQDGIHINEFAPVDDINATVDLMAGVMTAAINRVTRHPEHAEDEAARTSHFLLAALTAKDCA